VVNLINGTDPKERLRGIIEVWSRLTGPGWQRHSRDQGDPAIAGITALIALRP
jgi:hypothetical protein